MQTTKSIQAGEQTQTFTLAQVLSITTGVLLCDMGGVYEILNRVTGDKLYTHALPRAMRFAAPLLLSAFPELAGAEDALSTLQGWLDADRTERKTQAVKMWLAEFRMKFPDVRGAYDVPCHSESWLAVEPIQELASMVGPEKVIVVATA